MDLSLTGGFSIDLRQLLAISVFPSEYFFHIFHCFYLAVERNTSKAITTLVINLIIGIKPRRVAYSPRRYAHVYILLQALLVACENIRFSSLFAAGDVRGETNVFAG